MGLRDDGETLSYDIAFTLGAVSDPSHPFDTLGATTIEVCDKLRAIAVMVLLVKADTDRFHHNLIRSALARERYLARCLQEGAVSDHHRASGRSGALLDAITAVQLDLAARIAALSPADMLVGHEYEDDYCFAQAIHRWLLPSPPDDEVTALLDRFEAYRPEDARIGVCRALSARDQAAFDAAFDELLVQRDADIEEAKARASERDPVVEAHRLVYVDGLALLRLAGLRGLATRPDYRFCPSLARLPMRAPFPGE
jgi:hypothetical protein